MTFPIPNPITPGWLTEVLRGAGALPHGAVESLEIEGTGAFNSVTSHLVVRYSSDAPPDAPTHLIIKRNIDAEWGKEAGKEEARFYTLAASFPAYPPGIVPCYAAAYDETSGASYVLLSDLSATHRPPITRAQQIGLVEGVPAPTDIAACVTTLARLHAFWWEHPHIATDQFVIGYWSCTAERFALYHQRRTASWSRLLAQPDVQMPDDVRAFYIDLLAHLPRFWKRYLKPRFEQRRHLTLVHGDAYFANFLCPRPSSIGPTYLLDWQEPTFDIGGYDLANLCATFWTPEQRHADEREEGILRRYHAEMVAHGVTGYSWEDLVTDYQLGLIYWVLVPVQDGADGSDRDYWWPKMRCLLAAFHDWRCEELLGMDKNGR